jgi:hypothetical protein
MPHFDYSSGRVRPAGPSMATRPCQTAGCQNTVTRGGKRGPWPRFCVPCRKRREAEIRVKMRVNQAIGTDSVQCRDCTAVYPITDKGNWPERCETCTRIRKRKQAAVRQARWRARHAKAE